MQSLTASFRALTLGAALISLAACDTVTDPPTPIEGEFTVDASASWKYVSLTDSAEVTPSPAPRSSDAWDIAFFSTNVTLNGGAAGPGGVSAACICQNASATNEQILAMTADSELADFESVTSVPTGISFTTDALTPAAAGWYTGSGAAAVAAPGKVFLVRLSDGASYAKVHVTSVTGATADAAGQVTLEYAVQTSASADFGATKTIVLSAANAAADLNTDAHTMTATAWDLQLDGWNLLVNGGVSGPGSAAVAEGTADFTSTTTAVTVPQAYRTDTYAGVFGTNRWYKYNILGDNRISPTFDVYLIKRGTAVYKLQIVDYYSATGAPRNITFRYEQIAF